MMDPILDQKHQIAGNLTRGRVCALRPDGLVEVDVGDIQGDPLVCQVLVQGDPNSGRLAIGQQVLITTLGSTDADGIVLGIIGRCSSSVDETETTQDTRTIQAKQIVIEASDELELRCGKGTIKIQKDGKVVIRGENILNKANGTNRIKGGSVGIN